jgi:hypothetical protein
VELISILSLTLSSNLNIEHLMEYFKPDDTWEVFGIKSKEEYLEKNVIPGNFHPLVPEDVIKSFKTVTHLTAQAYYYYPIYDEALNKCLRIFELAIKLKAKQLGLKKDSLNNLINKLCQVQHLEHLKKTLHRARTIRNMQMHPENHSAGWFMIKGKGNIQMFANFINEMFLEEAELNYMMSEREKFEDFRNSISENPFCIQLNENEFYAEEINSIRVFPNFGSIKAAISVVPYYENITDLLDKMYTKPYVLYLKDYRVEGSLIMGETIDGINLSIGTTKSELAMEQRDNWLADIQKSEKKDWKDVYFASMKDKFIWKCEEMIYRDSWNREVEIV